ncbi:hypothetical protein MNBD_GAMMA08-1248 [hydrothermal vent metagenome]|uniref:Uncharacterized protein n=1 Tax=hydrothermal vent metagenome TaxID=652676 RepID=A0A3B0XWC1_9ZZZZ
MNNNERILAEIETRIKTAREELPELSQEVAPILDYYDGQSVEGLAQEMMNEISDSLSRWGEKEIQAGGFEWYYDGCDQPQALGYTFESVTTAPDILNLSPIGSNTSEARADFDGHIQFGNILDSDNGGFDVGKACFPVYDCVEALLVDDDDDEIIDKLISLFTLRMFHCLHLVYRHLAANGVMSSMKLKCPTYFFANNHDWSPFLLFVYNPDEKYTELTKTGPTRVTHLQNWFEGMKDVIDNREARYTFLRTILQLPPRDLERNLLSLPFLTDTDGHSMEFSREELDRFGSQQLSDPKMYMHISFDAFSHYFRYVFNHSNPDIYELKAPLTFLFVRDPEKAYEFIVTILAEQPIKKEAVLDCASNSVRWASDKNIEKRCPNPTLALSNSSKALNSMKRLKRL